MKVSERGESPDLQISLVNTSNRELLGRCLASLPEACENLSWAVTVVDNASDDGSAEMVARDFPDAKLIRNERRLGFAANHNQVIEPALAKSTARYLLILNEDTELDPGAVSELVAYCDAHPDIGAAGPLIRGDDGAQQPSYLIYPTPLRELTSALLPGRLSPTAREGEGWLNGSCVLVRATALREIGPLDERFFIFYEDTDLGLRLKRAGWRSALRPSATILHHGHQTVMQPRLGTAFARQMIRSRRLYLAKHSGALAASIVDLFSRLTYLLRALKASAEIHVLRRADVDPQQPELLLDLARYDPRRPLPHEIETAPHGHEHLEAA